MAAVSVARIRRLALLGAVAALCAAVLPGATAGAARTDQAFDPVTGALDVDYAGYLAKHDIVYNTPQTDPRRGLTVGNGRTGAMVWSGDGLTMQVSGADLSEQSAYAAGLVSLDTDPGLGAGSTRYQQRLSLYDGTLTTSYGTDRTVTVLGVPGSEVMGVHVEDARTGQGSTTLELSMWDPATVTDSADVPDLDTWKQISTFADSAVAGFSRGQRDPGGFGYTLAATVEGAAYTTQVVGDRQVRLTITPTANYTIWFTAASRIDAAGRDSVAAARSQLAAARSTGYLAALGNSRGWWHAFWQRSFVQYSGAAGTGDYLENIYYLATYMIAAGGHGDYPFHFVNGVFRATQDRTAWSTGYWHRDQGDVYNSLLASNHADLVATENRLYSRNFSALKAYTRTRFAVDGIWVPEAMGWDGNARTSVGSDFVDDIYSTGAEAAYGMYLQYRYTNDTSYLRGTAYPFMREVVRFYRAELSRDASTGRYFMARSNAAETYWDVQNAITDLAAVRLIFPLTIAASAQLGLDADLRAGWQDVLDHLAPYRVSNGAWLPHDPPAPAPPHNSENVTAELIWPYDLTGIGAADYPTALHSWNTRPSPYSSVAAGDAVQAARLGLGDQALAGLRLMLQRYQQYPNGLTGNTDGVFEYLGVHLAAINESLMQSYDDRIRVFPAAPADTGFSGRFTLLAKDGFLVSAEREAGETKYAGLRSLYGRPARVVNPWSGQQIRVRRTSDGAILATTSAAEVTFATAADAVYVIERTAEPLRVYSHTTLTAQANNGRKTLAGTAATLGSDGPGGPGLGGATAPARAGLALRAQVNTRYVTAGSGGTAPLVAGRTAIGPAEQFDLVDRGGGLVALRARVNGQFVCAENAGANPLVADRARAGPWETFRLIRNSDTSVSLQATVNNRYVTAESAGSAPLIANRDAIGPWEKFDLVDA
ncbi:glycosyl hydrolase family 95 catalytic domain-containing protein [Dactylosporangium vinaceum]|uniref:Carbohydrate-binding protein n=1 Tax=Dactylosporangium vinaceum TaxID=53362 RepID=A0ABV5MC19_9ACTN